MNNLKKEDISTEAESDDMESDDTSSQDDDNSYYFHDPWRTSFCVVTYLDFLTDD